MAARTDPLESLARLRRLETGTARRRLAEAADRLSSAEARAEAARAALLAEQGAGAAADYAAWLGKGMAERDRSTLGAAHAVERMAQGRAALAEARVAERCIEQLLAEREAEARARLLGKAQLAADDAAGRKAHSLASGGRGRG
ncbi:hypothetical protein GCM10009416_08450 [Craurococcus roseus]|uniref:Flagellar FliJ protein n=1 Tax=Craurococcus roseus TaxID=77585 RepID=A0ABP3PTA0_9PROT